MTWTAVRVPFEGPMYSSNGDIVLIRAVAPFVTREISSGNLLDYFFIRYHDESAHIRLRLRDSVLTEQEVCHRLQEQFNLVDSTDPRPANFNAPTVTSGTYERELGRYGGPLVIDLIESMFCASSRYVLSVLLATSSGMDHESRLGRAVALMVADTLSLTRDSQQARHILGSYAHGYLMYGIDGRARATISHDFQAGIGRQSSSTVAFIRDLWKRIERNEPTAPSLDEHIYSMKTHRAKLMSAVDLGHYKTLQGDRVEPADVEGLLIPSLLHMTNNRLGLDVKSEAFLALLLNSVIGC